MMTRSVDCGTKRMSVSKTAMNVGVTGREVGVIPSGAALGIVVARRLYAGVFCLCKLESEGSR